MVRQGGVQFGGSGSYGQRVCSGIESLQVQRCRPERTGINFRESIRQAGLRDLPARSLQLALHIRSLDANLHIV